MYKLLQQITALAAALPQVMSSPLKAAENSNKWIDLTDGQIFDYFYNGGLYLEPGQIIKLGRSYDKSKGEKWLQGSEALNDAYTVKEEVDVYE